MRRLAATILLIPLVALALNYTDRTGRYADAPFSRSEAAAISLLTSLGAVQGNPDGSFRPERTLNRAEFLKIAFLSHPRIRAGKSDATRCFPDVDEEDWFSPYVCIARRRGVVQGYPDGYFHPENPVNYAEALKILGELYDYTAWAPPDAPWYAVYVQAAQNHKTILPVNLPYDAPLTRGQMARLAAAYRAEVEGELDLYRTAEQGQPIIRLSSASSTPQSSAPSSGVGSISSFSSFFSFSSSVSSHQGLPDLPARSRFLILGERSSPIASAAFFSKGEPTRVREVEIVFKTKIESIENVFLIDANGVQIAQLSLDPLDTTDKTWKATVGPEHAYELPKDEERVLAVEVRLKEKDRGGISEQLVQVDTVKVTVEGIWSHDSYISRPPDFPFPKHQTSFGRITRVMNALRESDILPLGSDQLLAAFSFEGTVIPTAKLQLEQLEFQVSKSSSLAVSGWELGVPGSSLRVACSVSTTIISCSYIPAELGALDGGVRTLQLYGDVSLDQGAANYFLQVSLNQAGAIGENGAIRWADEVGHFNWVELPTPLARSTYWQ